MYNIYNNYTHTQVASLVLVKNEGDNIYKVIHTRMYTQAHIQKKNRK